MISFKIVKDLDIEIETIEERVEQLERELYSLEKIRDTHKIDLMDYMERTTNIDIALEAFRGTLEDKKSIRKSIERKMNGFVDMEYKVAKSAFVDGKTAEQISEEFGYSVRHIQRLIKGCKDKMRENQIQ